MEPGSVKTAGSPIGIEQAAAAGVDEPPPQTPPVAHAEAIDLLIGMGDGFGHAQEVIPIPLTLGGQVSRVVHVVLLEQVLIVVDDQGRDIPWETPQVAPVFQLLHGRIVVIGELESRSRRSPAA